MEDCVRCLDSSIKHLKAKIDAINNEEFSEEDNSRIKSDDLVNDEEYTKLSAKIVLITQATHKNDVKDYIFLRYFGWQLKNSMLDSKSFKIYLSDPSVDFIIKTKVRHLILKALQIQIEIIDEVRKLSKLIEYFELFNNDKDAIKILKGNIVLKLLYFDASSADNPIDNANSIMDTKMLVKFFGYKIIENKISNFFNSINNYLSKNYHKKPKYMKYFKCSESKIAESLAIIKGFHLNDVHRAYLDKIVMDYEIKIDIINNQEAKDSLENKKLNEDLENPRLVNIEYPNNEIIDNYDLNDLPIKSLSELNIVGEIWNNRFSNITVLAATLIGNPNLLLAVKISVNKKFNIFKNQAIIMKKMQDHKNYLSLYGAFEDIFQGQNCCCIVMEHCEMTLKEFFNKNEFKAMKKKEREALAYEFSKDLLNALYCLNLKGIKHKDIKPQNILMKKDEDGKYLLKVVDFDVSSEYNNVGLEIDKAEQTNVVGTELYAAPEVVEVLIDARVNRKNIGVEVKAKIDSIKADVYSTGLTLLEMSINEDVTGLNKGFSNKNSREKLQKKVNKEIKIIENQSLKEILKLMLVVKPKHRKNFNELVKEIQVKENTYKVIYE